MEISASFRTSGKSTSISHNNRDIENNKKMDKYHRHIQWDKTTENIVLEKKPIKDMYKDLFDSEVASYNAKQRRKDRKINDYYSKVKNDGSLDLQREFIVQFGDKDFLENYGGEEVYTLFANKLIEYQNWFKTEFPDLKVYNSIIHMDEATPHLHLNVIPVASGYKQGMKKRPSFSKWLKNNNLEFKEFREIQTNKLSELIHSMGAERKIVGTHEYIKPNQYREIMAEAKNRYFKATNIVENLSKDAENLRSEASELKKIIELSKANLNTLKDEIEPLKQKSNQLSNEITELESKKDYMLLRTQNLRSEAFELEININMLKDNKVSLEEEIEPFKRNRASLLSEISTLKQDLAYFSAEKEIVSNSLKSIKAKKELVEKTREKHLKIEPELTNYEVQNLINNASSGFGGLKGITLDVLKTIGKLISDLFDTVTWFKRYTQQLELENKMLKEPYKQKLNKFEERVAQAKETQASINHIPKDISKDVKPRL